MRVFLENRLRAHKARLARYIEDDEEGGTTTIEFVLWLPIFILILSLVIDVCFIFLGQAVMYDVASDGARQMSICTPYDRVLADTKKRATYLGAVPDVTILGPDDDTPDPDTTDGTFVVTITHDLADIDVVGILGFVSNPTISAEVTQIGEGSC